MHDHKASACHAAQQWNLAYECILHSRCKDFPALCVISPIGAPAFAFLAGELSTLALFSEKEAVLLDAGVWKNITKNYQYLILLCISEKSACDNQDSSVANWSALTGTKVVLYILEGQGALITEDITYTQVLDCFLSYIYLYIWKKTGKYMHLCAHM